MKTYALFRNTSFATVVVATLAGVVSNGLALDQRLIYQRDLPDAASAIVLPEIVVTATRLET